MPPRSTRRHDWRPDSSCPGAYSAAFTSLSIAALASGTWAEVTNRPYDADDPRYRDPVVLELERWRWSGLRPGDRARGLGHDNLRGRR